MTIQKISQNIKTSKLISFITMYRSSWSVFMTKTPNGTRKHRKGNKPRTCTMGQMLSFFFFPSFFRQASSILREPLTLVYAQSSNILYGAVITLLLFTTSKSLKALITTSSSKTVASSLGCHFHSYLYTCTLEDHLLPVWTEFCCTVMENFSSNVCLLLKE